MLLFDFNDQTGEKSVRSLASVILLAYAIGACSVQSQVNAQPEPKTVGDVFLVDSAHERLTPLPQEQWKAIGKRGWATATGWIQISGETSSLRIKAGDGAEFVFNVGNPEAVRLYQLTRKEGRREVEVVKVKGGFHQQRDYLDSIGVDITRYGGSSYKLVSKSTLPEGEYAIDVSGKVYTFGIDGAVSNAAGPVRAPANSPESHPARDVKQNH